MPRPADPAAPPAVLIAGIGAADDPLLDGLFADPGPLLPVCAADPERALGLARARPFAAVLALPPPGAEADGLALLGALARLQPTAGRLLAAERLELPLALDALHSGVIDRLLARPLRAPALRAALAAAAARHDLTVQVAALQQAILRHEREAAAAHAAWLALHDVAGASTLIGFGLEHLAQTAAGLDPAARAALAGPLDELQAAAAHLRTLLHGRARRPPRSPVGAPPDAPTASPAARGPDRVPVGELLDRVARLMQRGLPPGVRLELDCGPELWAHVDPVDISRVLVNLVQNAAQALRERGGLGQIALRARADGEGVRIEVEDDGPGVPPSLHGRLFAPGATTRAAAGGQGLGLHLSRELARENAGWLEHQPGDAGARFVVWVPG